MKVPIEHNSLLVVIGHNIMTSIKIHKIFHRPLSHLLNVNPPDSPGCFAPAVWQYWVRFHLNAEACHWSPKLAWPEPPAGAMCQPLSRTSTKQKTQCCGCCSTWETLQISNKGWRENRTIREHTGTLNGQCPRWTGPPGKRMEFQREVGTKNRDLVVLHDPPPSEE